MCFPHCVCLQLKIFSISISVPPLQHLLPVLPVHPGRADGRVSERVCTHTNTWTHTTDGRHISPINTNKKKHLYSFIQFTLVYNLHLTSQVTTRHAKLCYSSFCVYTWRKQQMNLSPYLYSVITQWIKEHHDKLEQNMSKAFTSVELVWLLSGCSRAT